MSFRTRSFKFDNVFKTLKIAGTTVLNVSEDESGNLLTPTVTGNLSANTLSNITSLENLSSIIVNEVEIASQTIKNRVDGHNLILEATGSGVVQINDAMTVKDVSITGNLTVNGTTTTVTTTNTNISDALILLSHGASGAPTKDSGLIIERGSSINAGLVWDESADQFSAITTTDDATTVGDITISNYANLQVDVLKTTDLQHANGTSILTTISTINTNISTANLNMKGYVDNAIASVPPGYADSDVADYLPTYSGNVGANYVNANFFIGDGSQLTGLPSGYSNVQTLAYLTTNSYATESYVTQANVGLKGYTDSQLSSKQATITGAATTIDTENLTASRALVSDGSGKVAVSDVTSTELGYLDGVTSAIQTQLNAKASLSGATFTGLISGTTLDLSGTTLRMTDGAPRLEMDSTGNSGQGFKKITCNDGGGNWNFRGGVYYSSGYKYETTGHGGADIVMNFESAAGAIYLRTFPTGTAGASATPDNTLTLNSSGLTLASGVFSGTATSARYADLAEKYIADADYSPGTVVVFGGGYEITESTKSHQRSVAGVISSQPAYLMNSDEDGLPVALQGRVPCKVKGPIDKGDLVVASDIPGVAQKLNDAMYMPGCVIGKALNSIEDDEIHSIEVVVGRL